MTDNDKPTPKGPLSRREQIELVADSMALTAWSPLPPRSYVQVDGRHGPSAVAVQHQPGGAYVMTSTGSKMKLGPTRQLRIGYVPAPPAPVSIVPERPVEVPETPRKEIDPEDIGCTAGVFVRSVPGGNGTWHQEVTDIGEANALIERLARLTGSIIGEHDPQSDADMLDAQRCAATLVELSAGDVASPDVESVVPPTLSEARNVCRVLARMTALTLTGAGEDVAENVAALRTRIACTEAELNTTEEGESA